MAEKDVKIIDDVIEHIESDIAKIQTKPGMYIGVTGSEGALHLFKEVFNNMVDECINPNSPGNEIDVLFDEAENRVTVSDNGRGIPFENMELVCTKLQAGSKFTRSGSGGSAGENGVGLTAVNALSSLFEIVVTRNGKKAIVQFSEGELITPTTIKKTTNDKSGTTFTFIPSDKYMGRGKSCQIIVDELIGWLEKIVYLIPHNVKTTLNVIRKGKDSSIQRKYRNKNGLFDLCKIMSKKPILDPIHIMKSTYLPAFDTEEEKDRFMGLELAFTYNESPDEMRVESFANFVNTTEHGAHVDATRLAIVNYISRQSREALSQKEAKTIEILPVDVTNGLVFTVYLSTNITPEFVGQTKNKLGNRDFQKPIRDILFTSIEDYFKKNPKDLKKITDYVKRNAKIRIESTKARNSIVKGPKNNAEMYTMTDKYTAPNNTGKNEYRELFLIEGDGAAGTTNSGRFDPNCQGTFALRGVPLNTYGLEISKVLANKEFRELVRVLRCGIGESFNEENTFFDKIIIMTDSDVDGNRITSLLCTFFICHLPGLVKAGRLYKSVAPLYKIKDKGKHKFLLNRKSFIKLFEGRISENIRLVDPETNVAMKHKELEEFLMINRNYLPELIRIANYYGVRREIVEFVTLECDESSLDSFAKKLKKKFPEMSLDEDNIMSGIYEGSFQVIALDRFFFKRIEPLKQIVSLQSTPYLRMIELSIKGDNIDRGVMSIGDIMALCQRFQPNIDTRYKGLGELNALDIMDTTLDPNNRILIQLTMEDLEAEIEKFKVLHGDSVEERKQLMAHFKIDRDDLDN